MSWPLFYSVVAGFLVALFAIISLPWLRSRDQNRVDQVRNAQIVKQRLKELEREVSEGLISEDDKTLAVTELKLALVDESGNGETGSVMNSKTPLLVGLLLAFGIGGWVYYQANHIGEVKQLVDATQSVEQLSAKLVGVVDGNSEISPQELQSLTLAIRQRLRDTPEDEQAWLNLGRLYMSIGFSEQSIASFKRAFELAPEQPTIRLSYAQALMLSGTEENLQRAERLLTFELEQQPANDNIRLMLTVIATQLGKLEAAESYFEQIKGRMNPDAPMYQTIVSSIQELRQQQGIVEVDSEAPQTGFTVTIELAAKLMSKVPNEGFIFVFAQDAESPMKLPAAVVKLPLQSLPVTVNLTQANAMMPNFTIEQLEKTTLVARISADEDVATRGGELQGSLTENVVMGRMVAARIMIDKEIE